MARYHRAMITSPVHSRALVLFSGGQDSTTCLAHALQRYAYVETIGFDYGQRHRVELQAREAVLAELRQRFAAWSLRLGEDHLGFGSDYDGCTTPDVIDDATGLPRLIQALSDHGYDRPLLEKLAHGNWLALLDRTL